MQGPRDYLVGLAQLHQAGTGDERRALWRQGLASLAMAATHQRPLPLEGIAPEALLASIRVALAEGLVDDVGWMSRGLSAAALFETAAALPPGDEKRELGRRVLEVLHSGDAATFALLATSLASSARRALSTPPLRARVGVAVRLPIGIESGVDRLALALLCRADLEREWLSVPSSGPLPARRVTARLLERAAREAARRALEGDDTGLRALRRPTVRVAWMRLLADRESLVWRHAATARGLLAAAEGALAEEIEGQLAPHLGPSEWRRAVTSLAASLAHAPQGLSRCQDLVGSDLFGRDPALGAAMIFGLSRAATLEPEAVEALLPLLLEAGDVDVMEAFVDLLAEHPGRRLATRAITFALERLRRASPTRDDGMLALRRVLDAELSPIGISRRPSLRQQIAAAQLAFADGKDLQPHVEAALGTARLALATLERLGDGTSEDRQRAFQILRELDRGLLETSLFADLMVVAGMDPNSTAEGDLGDVVRRLRAWLVAREAAPLEAGPIEHVVFRRRRLRALVHAIDDEGFLGLGEEPAAARERRLRTFDVVLGRMAGDPPSPLRRHISAALARTCEGLVRDELCELSDALVAVCARVVEAEDLVALAEAALAPELREPLTLLAELAQRLEGLEKRREPRGSPLHALAALAEALPAGLSAPMEAFRRALVALSLALDRIAAARSLSALAAGPAAGAIERLEESVRDLAELEFGVWRRLGQPQRRGAPSATWPLKALALAAMRASRGAREDLTLAVKAAAEAVRADLPSWFAAVVASVLGRLPALPADAPVRRDLTPPPDPTAAIQLPTWLPPSRVLGGFYVLRPIGSGAVGSVFVVRRAEERHDERAERYALKVPSYDGSVAHTLSEEEFLRLFREEAGALVTLPAHPNLASFVTFDARARPKPILVMELVEGPTLERMLERRDLSLPLAMGILDGIAAGLEAMHGIGIGHLDIKPANVILRASPAAADPGALEGAPPVLVDFGLAGRKVRPGCASPYYGAPEVWDTQGVGPAAEPAAADVYSFCCLAYELLVGRRLFTGDTLPAVVAAHFSHDGNPAALVRLREHGRLVALAETLGAGMVPDPRRRPRIAELRASLAALVPALRSEGWPVAA
jgi:hypothetical protein